MHVKIERNVAILISKKLFQEKKRFLKKKKKKKKKKKILSNLNLCACSSKIRIMKENIFSRNIYVMMLYIFLATFAL